MMAALLLAICRRSLPICLTILRRSLSVLGRSLSVLRRSLSVLRRSLSVLGRSLSILSRSLPILRRHLSILRGRCIHLGLSICRCRVHLRLDIRWLLGLLITIVLLHELRHRLLHLVEEHRLLSTSETSRWLSVHRWRLLLGSICSCRRDRVEVCRWQLWLTLLDSVTHELKFNPRWCKG